jgi:hypothetical protein
LRDCDMHTERLRRMEFKQTSYLVHQILVFLMSVRNIR